MKIITTLTGIMLTVVAFAQTHQTPRQEPFIFINGNAYFGGLHNLDPQDIDSIHVVKEGKYKDRGAVFIYSKKPIKIEGTIKLSQYLQRHFKNYRASKRHSVIVGSDSVSNPREGFIYLSKIKSVTLTFDEQANPVYTIELNRPQVWPYQPKKDTGRPKIDPQKELRIRGVS